MSDTESQQSKTARFLEINRSRWNQVAQGTQGRTALPQYGPLCPNEDELQLLGNITGKNIVEIGCGDGQGLHYLHQRGAGELYGIDLSDEQIHNAENLSQKAGYDSKLFCSPMERDPGLPHQYFDIAVSIYALGWSVDLDATLHHIYRYLRPGGMFVFSWEHPVFSCLKSHKKELRFARSYSEVGPVEQLSWQGDPIVMQARKMSTFLNAILRCGLGIEQVIEGDMREDRGRADYPRRWYSKDKAQLMPTTFIVKAQKPR